MYDMPAIIFAGGKSSRMGEDKALLPFGGYATLSEFQYNKLSLLFSSVYISTKYPKFNFDSPLIQDIYEESSPLVGLLSIFEVLKCKAIFILSVDAPLVDKKVIDTLFEAYESHDNADIVIAKSPNGLQPLCGIYTQTILPLAKKHFEQKNHKLTSLLKNLNTITVSFEEDTPFTNLNTPEEYKALFFC